MRIVPHLATVALALWWAPTFAVAIVRAAPYVAAGLTAPYRMQCVRRLVDRGDIDEAGRVIAVIHRGGALARGKAAVRAIWPNYLSRRISIDVRGARTQRC